MSKGRLLTTNLRRAAVFVIQDIPVYVRIYREIALSEVQIGEGFHTHIAPTDRQLTGRDLGDVLGQTGPQMNIMNAPLNQDVTVEDIVWTSDQRFRVIAIDDLPHGKQVLMRQLQ